MRLLFGSYRKSKGLIEERLRTAGTRVGEDRKLETSTHLEHTHLGVLSPRTLPERRLSRITLDTPHSPHPVDYSLTLEQALPLVHLVCNTKTNLSNKSLARASTEN